MPRVLGPDNLSTVAPAAGRGAPDLGVILTATVAVTGTGTVSATVQLEGSNDGANWFAVGAAINVGPGASPQIANAVRVQFSYAQYRHNCTAISGTAAVAACSTSVGS